MNKRKLVKRNVSTKKLIKLLNLKLFKYEEDWVYSFYGKKITYQDHEYWKATIPSKSSKYGDNTILIHLSGSNVAWIMPEILENHKEDIPSYIDIVFINWITNEEIGFL